MLPDLSQLPLHTGSKLFEHVAMSGGGKQKCRTHKEPIVSKGDEDATQNCAIDGYLMFKPVVGSGEPVDYSGKYIDVEVDEQVVQLTPLLKRTRAEADRKSEFERRHTNWINETFPIVCDRGEGLDPVTWESYGSELAKITEWYYLDEDKQRGHLFLQLLDTRKHKIKMHMPFVGEFEGRYLYVALVCAAKGQGYGKTLMKVTEAAARALGCNGIALASLSNSAGFYFSQGFHFVSKWDGQKMNVDAWTKTVTDANGKTKTILDPEKDPEKDVGRLYQFLSAAIKRLRA